MSAMITPEFLVPANDVLRVPFLVTLIGIPGFWDAAVVASIIFLGEMVNPVLGDAGEWVSRVLKDQVHGVFKMFSLNWLFGSWTVDIASEILSFSSKCYPSVLC